MPQLQTSTLDAFRNLDDAGKRAALGRMSEEAKRTLLAQIQEAPTQSNVYRDASGKLVDRRAQTLEARAAQEKQSKNSAFQTREKFGVGGFPADDTADWQTTALEQGKANAVGALQLPATMFHGAVGLGKGMYEAIGKPEKQAELLGGIVKSTAKPFQTMGRNVLALDEAAGTNVLSTQRGIAQMLGVNTAAPTPEENRESAEFA